MSYAKEFNHLEYNVPDFLLQNPVWEDVSWHNDVCPRWENYTLMLAVWVDCAEPECREYEDWKQYTVCEVLTHGGDDYYLADETLFATEDVNILAAWLSLHETYVHLENAAAALNNVPVPDEIMSDELHSLLAMVKERLEDLKTL